MPPTMKYTMNGTKIRRGVRSWVFVSCVLGPRERDPLAANRLAAEAPRADRLL
jgi:hypothetical protein